MMKDKKIAIIGTVGAGELLGDQIKGGKVTFFMMTKVRHCRRRTEKTGRGLREFSR